MVRHNFPYYFVPEDLSDVGVWKIRYQHWLEHKANGTSNDKI